YEESRYEPDHIRVLMEYVPGETFEGMIEALGPMTENEARRICCQGMDGVRYLHAQNPPIVQRAIRSANLLVNLDGCMKIADSGHPQLNED
ncbi:kinase-like domain-containing protein, partial [Mycena leptocephala]